MILNIQEPSKSHAMYIGIPWTSYQATVHWVCDAPLARLYLLIHLLRISPRRLI
jgi:hypothetical protein